MITHRTTLMSLVAGVVLAGGGLVTAAQAASPNAGATTAVSDSTLAAELTFARDEERMARDLYQAFSDTYDDALPFSRITRSEQQHFDAVGTLLDRYGVADPAEGRKAGSYADATVQKLYDGWLADGLVSLDAAHDVGAALEKRDIADLEDALDQSLPPDVTRVFTALLSGSRHHLAAFRAAADGQVLDPQDGRGYGMGSGPGMMTGAGGPGGNRGNRGGFDGDCPMLDAS